jgi:hypothetical protein
MIDYLLTLWPLFARVLPDFLLVGWVVISVLCRFGKMGPETSNLVALQYGGLFVGSVLAFVFQFVPSLKDYAVTSSLAGVTVFLALSSRRWRWKAPDGTKKLNQLPAAALHHVRGGGKP